MVNRIEVFEKLSKFGLSDHEKRVYVALIEQNEQTPLELSRLTGINRTTLYRVLEILTQKGLVREVLKNKSTAYSPAPPQSLEILVSSEEDRIAAMKDALEPLVSSLSSIQNATPVPTQTRYYRGRTGLRQLLYNTLSAKTDVIGFGYGDWNDGVGRKFAEVLRREYVERNIQTREILNVLNQTGSYTNVQGYFNGVYTHRRIPENVLPITHDTYIYNDIYSVYHMYNGEFFGVEIQNVHIAQTQRHIFEILWKIAHDR